MSVYDTMTPAQRSARARLGAHTLHSQRDGGELTAAATAASMARFEREVDPNNELEPAERTRRAEHARKAFMLRLSLASARARRERKACARPGPAPLAFPAPMDWHQEITGDAFGETNEPTPGQLRYLHSLGYRGTPPTTMAQADYLIDRLNREGFAVPLHAVEDEP
jgi:hypothetical protein